MAVGDPMILRAVVVDNDPDALDLVVTDLRLEGVDVVATAVDGVDAIDTCKQHRPDAVVLDVRMPPGIDGVAVAEVLQRETPDTTIVLYTNHLTDHVLGSARRLGVPVVRKGNLRALRRALTVSRPA
jgi:CheY-like chemotaxis protein